MKLLLIVAHPDDETFGCGSVLAHASASGLESVVLCATRGELGEVSGTLPPGEPASVDEERLGQIRVEELRAATQLLGASRVELLGWRDSGVDGEPADGSLAAAATADVATVLAGRMDDLRPDVVIVPEGSDGHRDHIAICDATLAALEASTWRPSRTYLWCLPRSLMAEFTGIADLGTPDAAITTIVDTSAHLDLRWQAMRAHATQRPPFEDMQPDLQRRFLATDYLIRLDPPWGGGAIECDWVPHETAI
jgi:N-acetyl-1-D-myo-inositol-2-amino-2-deoxy-alpha-D-glucopyranoside deacetylase